MSDSQADHRTNAIGHGQNPRRAVRARLHVPCLVHRGDRRVFHCIGQIPVPHRRAAPVHRDHLRRLHGPQRLERQRVSAHNHGIHALRHRNQRRVGRTIGGLGNQECRTIVQRVDQTVCSDRKDGRITRAIGGGGVGDR